jgi:hypothetical protein
MDRHGGACVRCDARPCICHRTPDGYTLAACWCRGQCASAARQHGAAEMELSSQQSMARWPMVRWYYYPSLRAGRRSAGPGVGLDIVPPALPGAWLLLRCLIGCRLGSGTEPLAACLLCGDRRRSSSYLLGQRTSARTSRP